MLTISYFVNYLMAPIIFAFGLMGNLLGLLVLVRKNLVKIGPRGMYRLLFMMDTIVLLSISVTYLNSVWNIDLAIISKQTCRLFGYFVSLLPQIPPYLLIYISVEKISSKKIFSQKNKNTAHLFLNSRRLLFSL